MPIKFHINQFMETDDQDRPIPKYENIPEITLKTIAMKEMRKVVDYCVVDIMINIKN